MIDLSTQWQYQKLEFKGCWHLAFYIPKNRAKGTLAGHLISFKDGVPAAKTAWLKWAGEELSGLDVKFDYIIRALGSQEMVPQQDKPCAEMGIYLANILNAEYIPHLLSKIKITRPLHTLSTYQARVDELHGVYKANDLGKDLNGKNVLVIDDITTTNCTMAEIKRSIIEKWPNVNLYLFCLGKTEYDETLNDSITKEYFN